MNYFIDFDNTLYNTPMLTNDMLEALAKYISTKCNTNYKDTLEVISNKFGRGKDKIYDIYDLISFFAKNEYTNLNEKEAQEVVNKVIFNGKKNLFEDSIEFLQYLKENGHKVYILTYNEVDVYYQTIKVTGSGLLEYVDGIMSITTMKGDIPLDFSRCIFIDDNPKDLISIYKHRPLNIFRIRRKSNKYSQKEANLPITEFSSFEELMKKLRKDKDFYEK